MLSVVETLVYNTIFFLQKKLICVKIISECDSDSTIICLHMVKYFSLVVEMISFKLIERVHLIVGLREEKVCLKNYVIY